MANTNLREVSMDTLIEILEHGQFSHIYLKQVLDKYAYFEKNERAFITRLVNGTVERKLTLDFIINNYSKTKVNKMKPLIRTILRMGVYEIYYMDSVKSFATCNEYVKLAKKRGFSGLSGFVNGVLRSIVRDYGNLNIDDKSAKYSMPQWIIQKFTDDFGEKMCKEILEGFFESTGLCIRANLKKTTVEELISLLEAQNISVKRAEGLDSALFLTNFDSVSAIKGFDEGLFYIQDYSSQLVASMAEIKSKDLVLDVCAAPGGKALHAAELAGDGFVEARDLTDAKVAIIEENIARMNAKNISAKKWDALILDESSIEKFDVVIADLPCSGLGIIRKKPDIKYNQTIEQLNELSELQAKILEVVCNYVKKGGTLCYSTCTINKAENEDQIKAFVKHHKDFEIKEMKQLFPTKEHDGFYICVLKKK